MSAPAVGADAQRRTWYALAVLALVWCLIVVPVALQVRSHRLASTDVALALAVGWILGLLVDPLWFGFAGKPRLNRRDGRRYVSARTMTGTRSVDLEGLVRVGRCTLPGRSPIDLLLLRDQRGARLALSDTTADDAIARILQRQAEDPTNAPVKISDYAAARLGLTPSPPGHTRRASRTLAGLARNIGALAAYAALSYLIARAIAG